MPTGDYTLRGRPIVNTSRAIRKLYRIRRFQRWYSKTKSQLLFVLAGDFLCNIFTC